METEGSPGPGAVSPLRWTVTSYFPVAVPSGTVTVIRESLFEDDGLPLGKEQSTAVAPGVPVRVRLTVGPLAPVMGTPAGVSSAASNSPEPKMSKFLSGGRVFGWMPVRVILSSRTVIPSGLTAVAPRPS